MAHFPNFGGKKSDLIPRKYPEKQQDGRMSRLYFIGTFRLLQGVQQVQLTAVDWHLKVKDTEHDVSLTKNYCTTVSMQKISSIHIFIFKIQQILGFNELNGYAHISSRLPENQEIIQENAQTEG